MAMNFFDRSSMNVSHLLNDIMIRILTETFEKQQTRQGELLFVKKQNKVRKFNCGYFFFQLRKNVRNQEDTEERILLNRLV
jgi:hypothetical protein